MELVVRHQGRERVVRESVEYGDLLDDEGGAQLLDGIYFAIQELEQPVDLSVEDLLRNAG